MRFLTYIICDSTAIKIGNVTGRSSLRNRLSRLQCGNPRKIFLIGGFNANVETSLHRLYKSQRLEGEWFELGVLDQVVSEDGFLGKQAFLKVLTDSYLNNVIY